MFKSLRNLLVKALTRTVAPAEVGGKAAEPIVRRRVEVTLERETVWMLVRGQSPERAQETAREEPGADSPALQALPAAPEGSDTNGK